VVTRDSLTILQAPNKGGRPRAVQPRSVVSVRILEADHDRICRAARAAGVSVSAYCRGILQRAVAPRKPDR
jgi:predicted HicB family RNase H-like nuclease